MLSVAVSIFEVVTFRSVVFARCKHMLRKKPQQFGISIFKCTSFGNYC